MAAAGFAAVQNASNVQVLHAAERALAPHLGLACDPGGGHTRSMDFFRARIASIAANRGGASVVANNNRNNASHPRAGD